MSLVFLARSFSEKLQRRVRAMLLWRRCRVKPLTFQQLERQRSTTEGLTGRCTCPNCRHARRSEDQ